MNGQNTYGNYNSDDIRRYLEGVMSPEEMHLVEKAALDDPFLADAIDGYRLNPGAGIAGDIRELRERLSEKTKPSATAVFGWWRIAAMLILVLGASVAAWYLSIPATENTTLAKNEELRPAGAADTSGRSIPGLNIIDTTLTDKRISAPVAAGENAGPAKDKQSDQGRNISPKADQETPAAAEETNKRELSSASVDRPAPVKLPAEKADQPGIAALSKESGIDGAGAKSKASPAAAVNEKNADARKFAPAGSDDEKPSMAGKEPLSAPTYYFRGRVTDEQNRPVPYASVRISNSNKGTYTDVQGRFSMVSADSVLHTDIQSVGFTGKKISLDAASGPAVIRLESSSSLSEVVISKGRSKGEKAAVETDSSEERITMPFAEPSEGWSLYEIYIKNNLRIPVTPGVAPSRGAVTISFYVDPDKGRLSDFRIEKSLGILHDKEAIRVLKDGPPWDVYNTDKKVRASFTIVF